MNTVAYILGAGFSAPLGLPVISTFLQTSKDMYQLQPDKYRHFAKIFERIDRMGKIKNYAHCNLFNIEEILSILEMESFAVGRDETAGFRTYIADVIHYSTPKMAMKYDYATNPWHKGVFLQTTIHPHHHLYFSFVARLFNLIFERDKNLSKFVANINESPKYRYHVISLNYDQVLENTAKVISDEYFPSNPLTFLTPQSDTTGSYDLSEGVWLAKLHGSIDPLTIVPPTWNKGKQPEIAAAWKLARQIISDSNHLVFLGYSMAQADRYMRYLMMAGILESLNLKTIVVVCQGQGVDTNYSSLFNFFDYKFYSQNIVEYLTKDMGQQPKTSDTQFDFGEFSYK